MVSDSYFEIGNKHIVCQDYALNGHSSDGCMYYAIISDGCSSSKNSEIGAQILCYVAKYFLLLYYNSQVITQTSEENVRILLQNSIYKKANEIRSLYGIEQSALDATLSIVCIVDNDDSNKTWVWTWGDGVTIYNYHDCTEIITVEYETGAPFYISYLSKENHETYKRKFGDGKVTQTRYTYKNGNAEPEIYTHDAEYTYSFFDFETQWYPKINNDILKSVIISSDGLTSYEDVLNESIPTTNIAHELLGYKRINGEFMKSNIIFMNKRHNKQHITHYDDMSCGIVLREK